jgi:hypothetical protein
VVVIIVVISDALWRAICPEPAWEELTDAEPTVAELTDAKPAEAVENETISCFVSITVCKELQR